MTNTRLLALVLGTAAMVAAPATSVFAYPPQEREHQAGKEYHFRQEDSAKLREHYKDLAHVDKAHREQYRTGYVAGGHLPDDWKKHLRPVPASVIHEMPPIPAGCAIGYIDGYCVVYVPGTLEIVDVIDLS
jgi:hypothetical protein